MHQVSDGIKHIKCYPRENIFHPVLQERVEQSMPIIRTCILEFSKIHLICLLRFITNDYSHYGYHALVVICYYTRLIYNCNHHCIKWRALSHAISQNVKINRAVKR